MNHHDRIPTKTDTTKDTRGFFTSLGKLLFDQCGEDEIEAAKAMQIWIALLRSEGSAD